MDQPPFIACLCNGHLLKSIGAHDINPILPHVAVKRQDIYTAKIRHLLYKCSCFLCAVYTLAYVWPTFNEEINM